MTSSHWERSILRYLSFSIGERKKRERGRRTRKRGEKERVEWSVRKKVYRDSIRPSSSSRGEHRKERGLSSSSSPWCENSTRRFATKDFIWPPLSSPSSSPPFFFQAKFFGNHRTTKDILFAPLLSSFLHTCLSERFLFCA